MARHSGKPNTERASRKAPRTLAGTASAKNTDTRRPNQSGNHAAPGNGRRSVASDVPRSRHAHNGAAVHDKPHETGTISHAPHNFSGSDVFLDAVEQGISEGNARVDNQIKRTSRRIVITAVAVVAIAGICFGWMGIRGSQRMHELAEMNSCKEAVTAMNTSYSKAFQLKAKVAEAFTSFDSSYDLDKLAELHKEEVKAPATLDCTTNIDGTIAKAKKAKTAYDKQAKEFKAGLKKIETEEQTE